MFESLFGRDALLRFRPETWKTLVAELDRRADGRRESGAFLLARSAASRTVVTAIYFDDLEPSALGGGIALTARAFSRLWDRCGDLGLRVIGDVHTHPSGWVCQSEIDQVNPMIAQVGHIALILPNLARGVRGTDGLGVHRYEGEAGWSSWCRADGRSKVYVGRFA